MALVKTTLRIPEELHRQLRMTAGEQGMTSEEILREALQRELDRLNAGKRRSDVSREIRDLLDLRVTTPSAFLAELFLQSMPAFAVIKDQESRIRWANFFFEETLGASLAQARGKTISDLAGLEGRERERVERNIAYVRESGAAQKAFEGLTLKNLGTLNIRAERFPLEQWDMFGDVSFIERDIRVASFDVKSDVLLRMQRSSPDRMLEEMFPAFLRKAPVAIALKMPLVAESDSIILWANEQYVALTRNGRKKKTKKVQGERTSSVFGIGSDHPLFQSEGEVVRTKKARITKETLPDRGERWSLRFPIFDEREKVEIIGVISPNFEQEDERTS